MASTTRGSNCRPAPARSRRQRLAPRQRLAVGALARHRVEGVDHGDDARGQGDLVAGAGRPGSPSRPTPRGSRAPRAPGARARRCRPAAPRPRSCAGASARAGARRAGRASRGGAGSTASLPTSCSTATSSTSVASSGRGADPRPRRAHAPRGGGCAPPSARDASAARGRAPGPPAPSMGRRPASSLSLPWTAEGWQVPRAEASARAMNGRVQAVERRRSRREAG